METGTAVSWSMVIAPENQRFLQAVAFIFPERDDYIFRRQFYRTSLGCINIQKVAIDLYWMPSKKFSNSFLPLM